jgi:DHA1 family multidrug resistance protein-like MFS transporter
LAAGGILPVGNAIIAESVPDARKGSVFGVSSSLNSFGRALGPMLGTLVVTTWSVAGVFPVTGAMLALNAITVTFTSRVMRKPALAAPPTESPATIAEATGSDADAH